MKSHQWCVGPLGLLAFVAGCEAILGIEDGKLRPDVECDEPNDCPVEVPVCRSVLSCTAGKCVYQDAPEGTPLPSDQQKVGDCLDLVCDGEGHTKQAPAADDNKDGDPCTIDSCNGVTPVHEKQSQVPCYSGPAGTNGVGICKTGIQQCDEDGKTVGSCMGEMIPATYDACEIEYGTDDDCDGLVDEDCFCGDGKVQSEFGEECDDGARADGDSCSPTCKEQRVLAISAGGWHTCALLSGGVVKCWGGHFYGQIGIGLTENKYIGDKPGEMGSALPAVELGLGRRALAISTGGYHSCALLDNQTVKCWGDNGGGQLGLGDTERRGDEPGEMGDILPVVSLSSGSVPVAIALGFFHSCAVLNNGSVKCWGFNSKGALGLEDTANRGANAGEMGDALPLVNLGSGQTISALSAGNLHTCALLNSGLIKCWGDNQNGKLGLGDTIDRGGKAGEMGDNLVAIQLGTGKAVGAISCGATHTCARLSDGSAKCWGANYSGELGLGDTNNRGDAPGEMGDALPPVDLGSIAMPAQIRSGMFLTCALMTNGYVKCWGYGAYLGYGDTTDRGGGIGEMGNNLPFIDLGSVIVQTIAVGVSHACALLKNGSVKCWGSNEYGQLGLGDTSTRGDEPSDMGDNLPTVKLFSEQW